MHPQTVRTLAIAALTVAPLLAAGCGEATLSGVGCPEIARASIAVTVEDSITAAPIAAGATLIIRDGAFVDSASYPVGQLNANEWALATPNSFERPGTYDVTVRRDGYLQWDREDVEVRMTDCGVAPVVLRARLQPAR
jgi:hypothetical protein